MNNPHPNAAVTLGTGGGLAALLYVLTLVGVHIPDPPTEVAIFIGTLASSLVLLIGKDGLRGIFEHVWKGSRR